MIHSTNNEIDRKKNNTKKDTLYFDGTCPLCSKEITLLKKLSDKNINFVDIHTVDATDENIPARDKLLQRLHLQRATGEWLLGLDATVAAWSYTPYGIFFKILRWPVVNTIADSAYTRWAKKRFKQRYKCSTCC